jgi:hypothetical protein
MSSILQSLQQYRCANARLRFKFASSASLLKGSYSLRTITEFGQDFPAVPFAPRPVSFSASAP